MVCHQKSGITLVLINSQTQFLTQNIVFEDARLNELVSECVRPLISVINIMLLLIYSTLMLLIAERYLLMHAFWQHFN